MRKFAIGVDFGTLSGRALLVDIANGNEIASAVMAYPHGVMDERLLGGAALPPDFALQHPRDYLEVLFFVVSEVMRTSAVDPRDVVGIGIDVTSCTVLPVDQAGEPLCYQPAFQNEPHAYIKLWKHHAAQHLALKMQEIALARGEAWLARYGGKISSESQLPKLWEVLLEAPQVYEAMDEWMEVNDWLVRQMTGADTRNASGAGYKGLYGDQGYPERAFFASLDARLENVVAEKLRAPVIPLGACAGGLLPDIARKLSLLPGTPVAAGNIDAHVCVPAAGITQEGRMLAIIGTSTCHLCMGARELPVPGICGTVKGGILPGLYGYEAGQSCCGDHFMWFADHCVPEEYVSEAARQGVPVQGYLTALAERLRPGESGLIALDWWNGNRSILTDVDLTGLMMGMTLQTKPEEMYRALLEATAYGTRVIIENFRAHGIQTDELIAAGGISQKNALMMQIYADVLNMPVRVAASSQCGALGSAIFASVAAGAYSDVPTAARAMGHTREDAYRPIPRNAAAYDALYKEYLALHDYFGRGGNDVMKRLKRLRAIARREE